MSKEGQTINYKIFISLNNSIFESINQNLFKERKFLNKDFIIFYYGFLNVICISMFHVKHIHFFTLLYTCFTIFPGKYQLFANSKKSIVENTS